MATVKFLLQSKSSNAPIYVRLSIGRGNTPTRKTGLNCNAQNWSKAKGFPIPKDTDTKKVKANLSKLELSILNAYNRDNAEGLTIDGQWLEVVIDSHFGRKVPEQLDYLTTYGQHFIDRLPYKVTANGGLGVKVSTVKKYKSLLSKLKAFEVHAGKRFLLKEVDLKYRGSLIKYLAEVDGLGNNTIGRYIKFAKTFVLDAQKNGYEINAQIHDFKGFTEKASKVTLSFEELDKLRATSFEDDNLEAAKDWLIIGCYTGQRVSDLLRMKSEMITDFNGMSFIVVTQVKTGKTVQIPIHSTVEGILSKREGRFPSIFSGNSDSNSALFNRYLKRVCLEAGIVTPTEGALFNTETKRTEAGIFPKWKLVSSHICRRSFATNFYANQKYPTPLLMNITAHGSEKMFLEYIGKPPLDKSMQLAQIWAQEKENSSAITKLRIVEKM